jgi:hypothetical protein
MVSAINLFRINLEDSYRYSFNVVRFAYYWSLLVISVTVDIEEKCILSTTFSADG